MFKRITLALDNYFYPGATRVWDDVRFTKLIRDKLTPDSRILDFGAGRGKSELLDFRKHAKHIIGADIDEGIFENPYLHEKLLISPGEALAIESDSLDLVYACNVLEHVRDPKSFFVEVDRVLKPGGVFMAKTTNKNHYIAMVARFTPMSFHKFYNRLRGREEVDTFPTAYRCNSKRQCQNAIRETSLAIKSIDFWEWRPEYLRISPLTYFAGILYERIVNATKLFAPIRAVMVANLQKPLLDPKPIDSGDQNLQSSSHLASK